MGRMLEKMGWKLDTIDVRKAAKATVTADAVKFRIGPKSCSRKNGHRSRRDCGRGGCSP